MFASADDVAALLNRTLTAGELDQIEALIDQATAAIQSWTRQTIESVADDEVLLAGTWAADLELPQRPVTAVSTVAVNGVAVAAGGWEWNERQLIRIAGGPYAFDSPLGTDSLQGGTGWHWGGPQSTVAVKYSHGFDFVPDDIAAVCRAMVLRTFQNPTGDKSETIGSYSVTYGDGAQSSPALLEDEKKLLRRYRRWWA